MLFVYRDEYYLQQRGPKQMGFDSDDKFHAALDKWQQDMERVHNRAEVLIEKNRHGPTGKIDLLFEGEFTRFRRSGPGAFGSLGPGFSLQPAIREPTRESW